MVHLKHAVTLFTFAFYRGGKMPRLVPLYSWFRRAVLVGNSEIQLETEVRRWST